MLLALLGCGTVWAKQAYSPEKRLQHLTKTLSLDVNQQVQISSLMKAQREKMKQLKKEGRLAIEEVLTKEQKEKFSAMREKHKQKRVERKESR